MSKKSGIQETRSEIGTQSENKKPSCISQEDHEKAKRVYEKNKDLCEMLMAGPDCADRSLAMVVMLAAGVI